MTNSASFRVRSLRCAGVVVGCLISSTSVAACASSSGEEASRTADDISSHVLFHGLNPQGACGNGDGQVVGLDRAQSLVPYTISLPDAAAASRQNITKVSRCSSSEVVVTFASGVQLLTDISGLDDPSSEWKQLADSDPQEASVGSVGNLPALFVDPGADPSQTARGSVTFVANGTWMVLEGNGELTMDQLVDIARSIGSH